MPPDQRLLIVNDPHSTKSPMTTLTSAHGSLATAFEVGEAPKTSYTSYFI